MKTRWFKLMAFAMLLPTLVHAQSRSFEDDLYFNPKDAARETRVVESAAKKPIYTQQKQEESVRIYGNGGTLRREYRNVDEYNRRYAKGSEAINSNDTVDEEGQPFEYSERVRRFHNPEFTQHITDDNYVNIYIEDGAAVDIYYIDQNAGGWMSPFYYDRYYMPRYGYGWGSIYNYGLYYDPWGARSWGFYDPWYSNSWNYYGGYGYGGYYGGYDGGYIDGYNSGYYSGGMGGGHYSNNRNRLTADQRRFINDNGNNRVANTRTSGGMSTGSSSTRSTNGYTTNRDNYGTTRNGSGSVNNRSSVGTGSDVRNTTVRNTTEKTSTRTISNTSTQSDVRVTTPVRVLPDSNRNSNSSSSNSSSSTSSYSPPPASSSSSSSSSSGSSRSSSTSTNSSSSGRR